jgi:predicted transcriptional regulator
MDASDRFGAPDDLYADEDRETLAAIDRGIRASRRGEIVPLATVRELIPLWVAKYSGDSL